MAKKRKQIRKKQSAAPAQYSIGILHSGGEREKGHARNVGLLKSFIRRYYTGGSQLVFDAKRFPKDDPTKLRTAATALASNCNVLIASGGTRVWKALSAVKPSSTPLIFTSVSNPPAPNEYETGVNARTSQLDPERLDLLFELLARPTSPIKIRALKNPDRPNYQDECTALNDRIDELANRYGAKINFAIENVGFSAQVEQNIASAFSKFKNDRVAGVVVTADPLYYNRRNAVIDAASDSNIPTIYQWREFAEDGGLISYGSRLKEAYQLAGAYVATVLNDMDQNGRPTQIWPIYSPPVELVINKTLADDQGISIPPLMAARAEMI